MEEPGGSNDSECEQINEINGETSVEKDDEPMEIVKDDEAVPSRLVINNFDDGNEETVIMSIEDAQNYILLKVETYIRDPDVNPLLVLKNEITSLNTKIQEKNNEFIRLNKMFEALYRDQVKFLRHIGVMPKPETKTVGVSVDLPWLPESIPVSNDMLKNSSKAPLQSNGVAVKFPKKESSGPIECIDLTDDADVPAKKASISTTASDVKPVSTLTNSSTSTSSTNSAQSNSTRKIAKPNSHPAPLPTVTAKVPESDLPPKPKLNLLFDEVTPGIVVQWDLPPEAKNAKIAGYELIGYQERTNMTISSDLWKKIGTVEPMRLPMSCTLTQFLEGFKYHFSIRAFYEGNIFGHYSDPESVRYPHLKKKN